LILITSIITRYLKIPYTVGLVISGLIVALAVRFSLPVISPETYLTILLPPIIYHSAIHFDLSTVRSEGKYIFGYAFLGTLTSAILIGLITHFMIGLGLAESLLLGIIISPTDPAAVVSTLQNLKVSERITNIIEGEALFNDGVAIILFAALIGFIETGILDPVVVTSNILQSIFLGMIPGLLVGYASYLIASKIEDEVFTQTILSLITMYGAYQLAAILGGSGIISAGIAGIIIGNLLPKKLTEKTFQSIDNVWEFLAFILTSLSFILIGVNVDVSQLSGDLPIIVLAIVIVIVSRVATIYGLTGFLNLGKNRLDRASQTLIAWAGLRGVVSIMLALILSETPIQSISNLIEIVFGVVLFSVLVQGITIRYVASKLIK
jgi:CPA1 family monovalent cation:H+ antiporter